jgi:hypothetical protein
MKEFSSNGFLRSRLNKTKKTPLMRWDLSFIDDNSELDYQEFTKEKSTTSLQFFLASLISLSLVTLFSDNELRQSDIYILALGLTFGFISLVLILLLIVNRKKRLKNPLAWLMVLQLISVIFYNEIFVQSQYNILSETRIYLHGIIIQTLLSSSLLLCCNWKASGSSFLVLIIYLNGRLINSLKSPNTAFSTTTSLCLLLIILLASFVNERWDRIYYKNQKKVQELEKFQNIIKEIIPCSILIFKKEKIVFYTSDTRRLLNHSVGTKIEDKLRSIVLSKIRSEVNDVDNKKETTNVIPSLDTVYPVSLYEFLTVKKKDYDQDFNCGLVSFWGFYNERHKQVIEEIGKNQDSKWDKTFDIKMCNISWDGEEAQIIIISEDLITQRIMYLNEQDRYKDKILATFSHELFTPLNGIIGILEIALESVCDVLVKKKYK